MTHLTTFEAGTRVATVLRGSTATMRYFNADLVSHKVTLVVLGHALFGGFAAIEFLGERAWGGQALNRASIDVPATYHEAVAHSVHTMHRLVNVMFSVGRRR